MKASRLCLTILLIPFVAGSTGGQEPVKRDSSVTPAPLVMKRDLLVLGAGAGLAFLAQHVDLRVRDEVRSGGWQGNGLLDAIEPVGDLWGGAAAVGAGFVLWGGGRYAGNATVAASGLRAVEAITVSGQITALLKGAIGRARPRVDSTDAWNVEFGRGFRGSSGDYMSMPSGHTTAAFAFAAAVTSEVARRAPERARLVGITTYGLAGITAYSRMHSNAHWLSDVTVGAAIGMASGWAVTRWHATRPHNRFDELLLGRALSPLVLRSPGGGTLVGASIAWR
ncbi:MAG: phosphatase PAP2 family protein [Gemmatimonadetes bacterium]|nr:phosphatase PAP2 family protein [Gemmatimonadota bacterium]